MIIAHHFIWTPYGWWLPNDPRGSSSHEIRVERIAQLGELHHGRKAVQPKSEDLRQFFSQAANALKHPLLELTPECVEIIAKSFAETIEERNYTCYACAIMPDHVHMLVRRQRDYAETMIEAFQKKSRDKLIEAGSRSPIHPVWGGPGWKRFLNTQADIERVIRYIEDNPAKAGLTKQIWPFVTQYDGWLPAPVYQ